ncbi:MAG TPA: hypothetical protein VIY86_00390, partial [Pirellulaceae bacterium]
DVSSYDWDGDAEATPSSTTIASGKTLRINATRIESPNNASDGFDGTIHNLGGTLHVNTHGIQTALPWRMEGNLNLAGSLFDPARVEGSTMIVGDPGLLGFPGLATVNVPQGIGIIEAPVIFESSARVTVDTNSSLRLGGHTTYQGGTHTGSGTIVQAGDATVESNTLIDVQRYYLDGGTASTTTIEPNAALTLDVRGISSSADNRFNGTLQIQGGDLDMQTHSTIITVDGPIRVANPWRMAGTMNLNQVGNLSPTVTGSSLIVGEPVLAEPGARVTILGAATIDVAQVTLESRSEVEFSIDGKAAGQFDQLDVSGHLVLNGLVSLPVNDNGGSYLDPVFAGTYDAFDLITVDSLAGTFGQVVYDGILLQPSFASNSYFRSYQGEGLFRNLEYDSSAVLLVNYRALPGDANGDLAVDGSDFNIWNNHKFTVGTTWTSGDFNGDGLTDGSDFNIWNEHKFTSVTLSAVPEPIGLTMLFLGLLSLLGLRRKGR